MLRSAGQIHEEENYLTFLTIMLMISLMICQSEYVSRILKHFHFQVFQGLSPIFLSLPTHWDVSLQTSMESSLFLVFSQYFLVIFLVFHKLCIITFSGILPFPGISHHGYHKLFGCSNETVTLVEK